MTVMFARLRRWAHAFVFVFTLVVLAITAVQANAFLPTYNEGFIIFTLIVTSATVLIIMLLTSYSQPQTELTCFIACDIGWVAVAAWAADVIGYVQCDAVPRSNRTPTVHGTMSSKTYCYEMKVIEAFSWTIFGLFMVYTILLIALTARAHSLGRPYIWAEPIAELPWFGQLPGYEGDEGDEAFRYGDPRWRMYPGPFQGYYPGMGAVGQQYPGGPFVVQQQPGQAVVIQPGQNGGAPTIQQIPAGVV